MKTKSTRKLDGQGRVILPSYIRKALNLTQDSAVTIEMTDMGGILITPEQKRCCICGERLADKEHTTIKSWNGDKYICKSCATKIQEKGGWTE